MVTANILKYSMENTLIKGLIRLSSTLKYKIYIHILIYIIISKLMFHNLHNFFFSILMLLINTIIVF